MGKVVDMTGVTVGILTVVQRNGTANDGQALWLCKCECGNQTTAKAGNLRNNHSKSCGCLKGPQNLEGQVFGRLTALAIYNHKINKPIKWLCKCECGNTPIVTAYNLTSGKAQSCGCKRNDVAAQLKRTHGKRNTSEYNSWDAMIQRCCNPNSSKYSYYGGRGIAVCEQWRNSFESFIGDMGPKPTRNHSIDRIDNNGNYEPGNCRWATKSQQNYNKRTPSSMRKVDANV